LFLTLSPEAPNAGAIAEANTVKRHAAIAVFWLNIITSPVGSSVSAQATASPEAANRQKPSGKRRQLGHGLSDEPSPLPAPRMIVCVYQFVVGLEQKCLILGKLLGLTNKNS
jgi:hypothetical protein